MKKIGVLLVAGLLLTGCAAPKDLETVSDVYEAPTIGDAGKIRVWLPEDTVVTVMENPGTGSVYLCEGYSVMMQTMAAGDLNATVQQVTGFSLPCLTLMEREAPQGKSYTCAWSAVGEGGDRVGSARIIDDGQYHYTVTVLTDAALAGELRQTVNQILESMWIDDTESS